MTNQSPPPLRHALGETRLIKDWIAARLTEDALAESAPGDGRSILVLPGMFTSDRRTRVMRRVLTKAGYDVHGWEMGRHMPGGEEILHRVDGRITSITKERTDPVTLVGWSLGGLVAREYAKQHPEKVAGVVTLGSPFSGNPRSNRAWRLWEFAAKQKIEDSPFGKGLGDKPPVDTTAIWSARDGIIPPSAARGLEHERDRAIEVNSGHFAMACAPSPLVALLRTLRESARMSGVEWLAAMLGLANVWLIVKRSVWNYPFALAMCALYLFIFADAKLYSDAGLQVFFIAINLYGWLAWARNRADAGEVVVERMDTAQRLIWATGTLGLCILWGTGMARLTDASFPYWDGSVAMISIISQILMAQRKLENWIGWIIVNALSIPLYLVKGLYPTMALYTILLGMAVIGWLQWKARLTS